VFYRSSPEQFQQKVDELITSKKVVHSNSKETPVDSSTPVDPGVLVNIGLS